MFRKADAGNLFAEARLELFFNSGQSCYTGRVTAGNRLLPAGSE